MAINKELEAKILRYHFVELWGTHTIAAQLGIHHSAVDRAAANNRGFTPSTTLTGITLWDYLDEKYPGQYPERLLRTLQRRVKHWQATQGPKKEVIFRQSVPAGHQGFSDFTHPNTAITIAGEPFKHLLYQFRLAYSGWRYAHIVQGGESYSALADGLQNALHKVGGAPKAHRTDSLSAAYVNAAQKQRLTEDYQALCQHYRMRPTTNNLGVSHENGAIEAPHGSLKRRIEQAIKLRGSAECGGCISAEATSRETFYQSVYL